MKTFKQMLPMLALMIVAGIITKAIMGGFAAFLWAIVIVAAICLVVFILYALEALPKSMMIFMDRITGRQDRLRQSRRSKLDGFSPVTARERVGEVLGVQRQVVEAAVELVTAKRTDRNREAVLAGLVLVGPRASGRSLAAARVAEAVYGSTSDVVAIDCEQVTSPADLFEDPESPLVSAIRRDNEAVIVLDHAQALTKAGREATRCLAALLDRGMIGGDPIAAECIVIANVDAEENDKLDARGVADMAGVGADFTGLFDDVIKVQALDPMDRAAAVVMQIDLIAHGFDIEIVDGGIQPQVIAELVDTWNEAAGLGAEEIERRVRKALQMSFARANHEGYERVKLSWGPEGVEVAAA